MKRLIALAIAASFLVAVGCTPPAPSKSTVKAPAASPKEEKKPEDQKPEEKKPEDKKPEDKKPEDKKDK
jgi:hypothetical protein